MHARVDDLLRDHDVGAGEDGIRFGLVAGFPVEDVVVGAAFEVVANDRSARIHGLAGVDDRRQYVVLDLDQFEGVAGRIAVFGDDERHLLALKAHLVGDENGLNVHRQGRRPGQAECLQVAAGDHGEHLGVREGLGRVDRDQPGVGDGSAQNGTVQHAGQHDVVDVVALAAHEARVFLALHAAVADGPIVVAGGRVRRAVLKDGHACTSSSVVSAVAPTGCSAAH